MPYQEETFHQRALFLGDHKILWRQNKGPPTQLTAVVLFPGMSMPVSFVPSWSTLRTGFSRNP